MKKLLQLKHWQLFLLLFGIPVILEMVLGVFFAVTRNISIFGTIVPVIIAFYIILYFTWQYTLGLNLYRKLPAETRMNFKMFRAFLALPLIYMILFCICMAVFFNRFDFTDPEELRFRGPTIGIAILFIVPLHLFAIFCMFYCLYFLAKELKSVELQRPVIFNDFVGEFFLMWFFFVGVWFLQPRINKLFSIENSSPGV